MLVYCRNMSLSFNLARWAILFCMDIKSLAKRLAHMFGPRNQHSNLESRSVASPKNAENIQWLLAIEAEPNSGADSLPSVGAEIVVTTAAGQH